MEIGGCNERLNSVREGWRCGRAVRERGAGTEGVR